MKRFKRNISEVQARGGLVLHKYVGTIAPPASGDDPRDGR